MNFANMKTKETVAIENVKNEANKIIIKKKVKLFKFLYIFKYYIKKNFRL